MMKVTSMSLAALALVVGCGDKGDDTATARVDDILALTGDAGSGATVYSGNCAACHGASGEGGTGPAMAGVVSAHSDEQIVDVVLNGEGSMPSFSTLADQEIADLLLYVTDTF